jgi:Rrf2 family protein
VLRRLKRAGLLRAARGAGGGYRFTGNAKRVTLMEVIELFEEIGSARPHGGQRTRDKEKALEAVFAEIDELAKATFRSITLETMLKHVARRSSG